jgi:hypothetical protein
MKISRIISNAIAKRIGYTVIGTGWTKRHYTHTYSEALEWVACYKGDGATIYLNGLFTIMPLATRYPYGKQGHSKVGIIRPSV